MARRRGFTLIELLVVIAIIGILAAMLFPVFARARESARKIQCLSNVKNIALAFQMYFTDYDKFPPGEHNSTVNQFFADQGCDMRPGCCNYPTLANPYLRWPVILDEYTKNRDIWRCPSAKAPCFAAHINGSSNWFPAVVANWNPCICQEWFPNGWGGTVTDSVTLVDGCPADGAGSSTGAVEIDYVDTHASGDLEKSMSTIGDPSHHLVIAEKGIKNQFWGIEQIAYPEACRVIWGANLDRGCAADWENCPETQSCGVPTSLINKFWGDATWRNKFARHMGGNNLGFADGHAKWWTADAMIAAAGNRHTEPSGLEGAGCQCLPEGM